MRQTAAFGGWRTVIVDAADEMNVNAANALLKLLEEPRPRTVFVLTTSRLDRVLPTIVSRCQRVQFGLLDARQHAALLLVEILLAQES